MQMQPVLKAFTRAQGAICLCIMKATTPTERGKLRAAAVELYTAGEPHRVIATTIGRSASYVLMLLHEAQVPLRPRGPAPGHKRKAGGNA